VTHSPAAAWHSSCSTFQQHCHLLLQSGSSHAIDVDSEECSCAPSDLQPDEAIAACSPFLVMHRTPIGHGTFGIVFK